MEFVIKGLVLCLIALAGVYQADAQVASLAITPAGTKYAGNTVTLTCSSSTTPWVFKKGATTITALSDGGSKYTITLGVLTFTGVEADSVVIASGWSCSGKGGTITAKQALDVVAATTTTTTLMPTTAGSGSGSGSGAGINGLPLVVMIFAVLVSFFLRH